MVSHPCDKNVARVGSKPFFSLRLVCSNEEHVINCTIDGIPFGGTTSIRLASVGEVISVLVYPFRFDIFQVNRNYPHLRQTVQLFRLRNSIMIGIDPEQQILVYPVSCINHTVSIPAIFWLIEFGQSKEAIWMLRWKLCSRVSEEFFTTVDDAISVAVESEEGIMVFTRRPCNGDRISIPMYVEGDAIFGRGEMKPFSSHIDQNRVPARIILHPFAGSFIPLIGSVTA